MRNAKKKLRRTVVCGCVFLLNIIPTLVSTSTWTRVWQYFAFYDQRSVTEVWTNPSPWSKNIIFNLRIGEMIFEVIERLGPGTNPKHKSKGEALGQSVSQLALNTHTPKHHQLFLNDLPIGHKHKP